MPISLRICRSRRPLPSRSNAIAASSRGSIARSRRSAGIGAERGLQDRQVGLVFSARCAKLRRQANEHVVRTAVGGPKSAGKWRIAQGPPLTAVAGEALVVEAGVEVEIG